MASVLAACADEGPAGGAAAALGSQQERACAVAVAAHVGKPVDLVRVESSGPAPAGGVVVAVRDGDRPHTCEVDGGARVLAIRHPAE